MPSETNRLGLPIYDPWESFDYNPTMELLDELVQDKGLLEERPGTGEYPYELYYATNDGEGGTVYYWDDDGGSWEVFGGPDAVAMDPHDNTAHSTNYASAGDLSDHENATQAHGSNGDVAGLDDVFSGSYTDLADLPTTFTPEDHDNERHSETYAVDGEAQPPETHGNTAHTNDYAQQSDFTSHTDASSAHGANGDVAGLNDLFSGSYDDLADVPSVFTPEDHGDARHSENYAKLDTEQTFNNEQAFNAGLSSEVGANTIWVTLSNNQNSDYLTFYNDASNNFAFAPWPGGSWDGSLGIEYNYSLELWQVQSGATFNAAGEMQRGGDDVVVSSDGEYDIQKDGTDGTGIINFKTG